MLQESTPTDQADSIVFSADSKSPVWSESPNPKSEASTVKSRKITRRDGLEVIPRNSGHQVQYKGATLSISFKDLDRIALSNEVDRAFPMLPDIEHTDHGEMALDYLMGELTRLADSGKSGATEWSPEGDKSSFFTLRETDSEKDFMNVTSGRIDRSISIRHETLTNQLKFALLQKLDPSYSPHLFDAIKRNLNTRALGGVTPPSGPIGAAIREVKQTLQISKDRNTTRLSVGEYTCTLSPRELSAVDQAIRGFLAQNGINLEQPKIKRDPAPKAWMVSTNLI